jgi:hypothetical protein
MACSSASLWQRPLKLEELHRLFRLSGHNSGGRMASVMAFSPSAWERSGVLLWRLAVQAPSPRQEPMV